MRFLQSVRLMSKITACLSAACCDNNAACGEWSSASRSVCSLGHGGIESSSLVVPLIKKCWRVRSSFQTNSIIPNGFCGCNQRACIIEFSLLKCPSCYPSSNPRAFCWSQSYPCLKAKPFMLSACKEWLPVFASFFFKRWVLSFDTSSILASPWIPFKIPSADVLLN